MKFYLIHVSRKLCVRRLRCGPLPKRDAALPGQVAASLCVLFFPSLCAEHWRHGRLLRLRHQSNVNCTASYSAAAILHDLLLRWPAHGSLTRSHAFILQCNTFRNGTRRVSIPLMPQRFLNRRPQSKNQICTASASALPALQGCGATSLDATNMLMQFDAAVCSHIAELAHTVKPPLHTSATAGFWMSQ